VFAIAIAGVGFWATYFGPLLAGVVDQPAFIHFHAAVYVGWLALFLAQTTLAATGRIGAHIKLGRFAAGYGVLVVAAGLLAAFGMFTLRVRAGDAVTAAVQLVGPLFDMLVFAPLLAAAVYFRRRPEVHKRLMVVATTTLLIAAVARTPMVGQPRNLTVLHLLWFTPILAAMAHDFWRQRRVHPVYSIGLVVLLLDGPLVRNVVRGSDTWRDFGAWLATRVA
jgi:hypothetical protein